MAELRIGTCSWKFPSWVGLVYSTPEGAPVEERDEDKLSDMPLFAALDEEVDTVGEANDEAGERAGPNEVTPKQARYLVEYAQQYTTVEIDQWFWSLFGVDTIGMPKADDVAAYRAAVDDDFRFTVKAPNSVTLTHFYEKAPDGSLRPNPHFLSVELFNAFVRSLKPLWSLLGPVFFQFEYLNQKKMPTQARFQAQFGDFRRQIVDHLTYGLEVRNPKYINQPYFQFLEAYDLIPVLIQGYWMPDLRDVYAEWRDAIFDHDTVILRLMGPDRKAIEKLAPTGWHSIVLPKDDELPDIAKIIEEILAHDVNVYVNVNNHYEGSSPLTIAKLRGLLGIT
jgi:uncharacterized protein YecE (DUF72 family)